MTPVLLIGLLVTLLLSLSIAIILLLIWRKKHNQHAEFERLLDDIKERQEARASKLSQRLIDMHDLSETDAKEISKLLIVAEKRFLQQFIDQQLQQKSIECFYQQLCELLDDYLNSLPANAVTALDTPGVKKSAGFSPNNQDPKSEFDISASAPDWGDVFD